MLTPSGLKLQGSSLCVGVTHKSPAFSSYLEHHSNKKRAFTLEGIRRQASRHPPEAMGNTKTLEQVKEGRLKDVLFCSVRGLLCCTKCFKREIALTDVHICRHHPTRTCVGVNKINDAFLGGFQLNVS